MTTEYLHHYTDIDTLALILKYQTIRFNRLDHVDDLSEAEAFTKLKLGPFFFVSCWTHNREESLPQWNMYTTDMAGVRITLPKKMFEYKPLTAPEAVKHTMEGTLKSPIPFERIYGEDYFVLPNFLDERHFAREVEYTSDYAEKKNKAIQVELDQEGKIRAKISDPTGIAALKSPNWAFQKEYRFVLMIFPSPTLSRDEDYFEKLSNQLPGIAATSLYRGIGPNLDYFDVDVSQSVINRIVLTAGPRCSEGDYLIIEALMDKYASKGVLNKSKFTKTIRRPGRQ